MAAASASAVASKPELSRYEVERTNLLNMAKLAIKGLLESSMKMGRTLDDSHGPLKQFFVVMEHVMRHGLKDKRNLPIPVLGIKKDFWGVAESLEKASPECSELVQSARNLPGVKTGLGRGRAWMRLAVMQKKLAEYFQLLIERRDIISEWYEPFAMMAVEEGAVVAGMLVGLNVIDCNLCLKGEDLDKQASVIDFSLYLKDGNYLERPVGSEADARAMFDSPEDPNYTMLLDQKAYLEELNGKLKLSLSDMQKKLDAAERVNAKLVSELADLQADVTSLQVHRDRLQSERKETTENHRKQIENAMSDIMVERETYQQSREGLNELLLQSQKQLDAESKAREEAEKDAALQSSMRQECEVAMKLLEKDIHEKQDTIIALRKQLEDVKSLNVGMHQKLQASENTRKHQEESIQKLNETVSRLSNQTEQLSASYTEAESNRLSLEETLANLSQQVTAVETKKSELEMDLTIRKEWIEKLQADCQEKHEKCADLQAQLDEKAKLKKDYEELHRRYRDLESVCSEQETALVEMGDHLRQSRMQVSDLKQVTNTMKDYQWTDDRSITDCRQCSKPFSVARRKHHCRNCGGVFCSSCSDNTMPLPSSAKPVRVCDGCHELLLNRFSVT